MLHCIILAQLATETIICQLSPVVHLAAVFFFPILFKSKTPFFNAYQFPK